MMMVMRSSEFTESLTARLTEQEARRFGPVFIGVAKVLCEDGRQRYARLTSPHPDTYFSIPASVQVYAVKEGVNGGRKIKHTVSGFVSCDFLAGQEIWRFYAIEGRKNSHLMKRELPY